MQRSRRRGSTCKLSSKTGKMLRINGNKSRLRKRKRNQVSLVKTLISIKTSLNRIWFSRPYPTLQNRSRSKIQSKNRHGDSLKTQQPKAMRARRRAKGSPRTRTSDPKSSIQGRRLIPKKRKAWNRRRQRIYRVDQHQHLNRRFSMYPLDPLAPAHPKVVQGLYMPTSMDTRCPRSPRIPTPRSPNNRRRSRRNQRERQSNRC